MLEQLSEYFHDPLVFWGVPLVLALMGVGIRGARAWLRRRRT
jgi:hypothetical protein